MLPRLWITLPLLALMARQAHAQCPQLFDYYGNPSSTPAWYSCSGNNFSLLIASPTSIGAYTINWGDGSAVQNGASLIPPGSITHVYTSAVDEYTITFTEVSTGCVIVGTLTMEESTSASIQIPVGGLTQVCAPQAVDFINSSTNVSPNTTFVWDFGDGSPTETYDHTNLGQTVTHMYLQGTVDCETTVTLTAENTCNTLQGGPSFATFNPIRVWDLDEAAIAASATLLCWPDRTVTFQNVTDRNCLNQGNIFQRYEWWNFGDYWGTGQDSIIDWSPWPPTFPRTIQYPGIGSYDVQLLDSNYCGIDSVTITITIVPPPSITLTAAPTTICAGGSVQFDETTVGGANTFSWNFGDGGGWQNLGSGDQSHIYNTAGTYTARYAVSIAGATAGCTDTASVVINVLPSPTALFALDVDAACNTLVTDPTNTSVDAISQTWDFGDGTTDTQFDPPPHTYPTVGDYTITLTALNADGCSSTYSVPIHVYDPPQVVIATQNVCVGALAEFEDQSVTAPGNPVVQWAWDFGDGAVDSVAAPQHMYAAAGSYFVTLTATTPYCSSTGVQPITVEAKPTASFTTSPTVGCSPMSVVFTNTSSGAVQYAWDLGNGNSSPLPSPTEVFLNPGTTDSLYTVSLIASTTFGCSDTALAVVTVAPGVVAAFTHDATPGCAPLDANFSNTSIGATSYQWSFGDGSTSSATNPFHQYVNNTFVLQTDTIILIATGPYGCADTTQQTLMVYPAPNFVFYADPDSGCAPLTITFPTIIGAVDFIWDFGDGVTATGPTPTHTYMGVANTIAQYPVTVMATNAFGCGDTLQDLVTIFPQPLAQFTASDPAGCTPFVAQFDDLSVNAVSLAWELGDGTILTAAPGDITHTYTNSGNVVLSHVPQLIATSVHGCQDTTTQSIDIYPGVYPAFTLAQEACSPFTFSVSDQGTGATQWMWDMGDGNTLVGQDVTHTYVNTGNADVTYTVLLTGTSAFGCVGTVAHQVIIHPVPSPSFVATPFNQQFPAATVNINNTTANGSWGYEWSFGDGATSPLQDPGSHTYSTWGTFTIVLVVSSGGCTDTASQQVVIGPPLPTASFLGQGEGCAPLTVDYTNTSLLGETYFWNFGDGGTSQAEHPSYTWNTPGTYTVTLTVTAVGGGVNTAIKVDSVIVHPRAQAFFAVQPEQVVVPSQPIFTYNLSTYATSFLWDLGDGATYTELNPMHYYQEAGEYTITLIANNEWNCPDTFSLPGAVTAIAAGEMQFPNAFTPGSNGPTDGVYDPNSYDNDFFHPVYAGVERYHLQVFNRWGELVFETFDVKQGWDGYYRGQPAKQDVYAWKAWALFSSGAESNYTGDLTLLR